MKQVMIFIGIFVVSFAIPLPLLFDLFGDASVPCQLQDVSVTVRCEDAYGNLLCQGSGTLISKEIDGHVRTFVLTAAHVVEALKQVKITTDSVGESTSSVKFTDPWIVVQKRNVYGHLVERRLLKCKVIKYSNSDTARDIAILLVRENDAFPIDVCADFMPAGWIPELGIELCHCGSLLGEDGANSYTTGVLSKVGREQWDQIDVATFPGSSGGGIYTRSDGKYAGMVVRGHSTQGYNLMVPMREIHYWAATVQLDWLFDPSIAPVSMSQIDKMHVEDDAVLPDICFEMLGAINQKASKPVVMHFYAPWCGPCRQMDRITFSDKGVQKALGAFKFVKVNTDMERALVRKYGITGMPTDIILVDGKEIRRHVGYMGPREYINFLNTT